MNKVCNLAITCAVFGLTLGAVRDAQAFGFRTCNGTPINWSGQTRMFRDRCSMPTKAGAAPQGTTGTAGDDEALVEDVALSSP